MTAQQTLFHLHPSGLTEMAQAKLRARSTDPVTSHVAASEAVRFAGSHSAQIVAILRETQGALTCHEIADRSTSLSYARVHKRMRELADADKPLVVNGPDRACRCKRNDPCDGRLPMQTWKVP